MKRIIPLVLAFLLLFSLCACAGEPEPTPPTAAPTASPLPIPSDSATGEEVETPLILVDPDPEAGDAPFADPTLTPPPEAADPDAELIADIEWYFNQPGMNGMLSCAFETITELRLREVLYQLTDDEVSYKDAKDAYIAAFGELYLDVTYMQDWSFENFVWSITGHSLEEFSDYEDLTHDPVSGLYFDQHGDTNYTPMKVLSVEHGEGGVLYVRYCSGREQNSQWFYRAGAGGGIASEMLLTLTTETNLPCQFLPISNLPSVLVEEFSW